MAETWDILYLQVDSQDQVVSGLTSLLESKGYLRATHWPRVRQGQLHFPPRFHFWVSPSMRGWVSVCRDFPPLVITTKEIASNFSCLVFECWIGIDNWGYRLFAGSELIDRFDSDPRVTVADPCDFSEWWEADSPYAELRPGKLTGGTWEDTFGGHPERLVVLPLREGTSPDKLRELLGSEAIFTADTVDELAKHIHLPNFLPVLLDPVYLLQGLEYISTPDASDLTGKDAAESVEQIKNFAPVAFFPPSADRYGAWAEHVPQLAAARCVHEAIRWFQWYGRFASGEWEKQLVRKQVQELQALLKRLGSDAPVTGG